MTTRQRRQVGPTQKVRHDELGDNDLFPSDIVEAGIVLALLVFMGCGAYAMYYLSTLS